MSYEGMDVGSRWAITLSVVVVVGFVACGPDDTDNASEETAPPTPVRTLDATDVGTVPDLDVEHSINVGGGPAAVTVGHDSVWVTNTVTNTVSRIDPERRKVIATVRGFPPVAGLYSIAATNDAVWVSAEHSDLLIKINPDTNKIAARVKLDGIHTLAGGGDALWATVFPEHLLRIDSASAKVEQEIATGEDGETGQGVGPTGVAVEADGTVWVVNHRDNSVAAVDPTTNTTTDVVALEPFGVEQLAVVEDAVWSTHPNAHAVSRVDAETMTQTTTVQFSDSIFPYFVGSGDGAVWVSGGSNVIQLDPDEGDVLGRARFMTEKEVARQEDSAGAQGLASGFGKLWVADWDEGSVVVIDP